MEKEMQTFTEIRPLGEGGFGTTTLVERDGKRYVLKRLKQRAIEQHGQAAIDLFLQESEYLRQLGDRPQIPALIDSGVDESPWILQEYIAGDNLEQILAQHTFSEAEIITLLKSILPVLQEIHSCGTIHRDIKPANIIASGNLYYIVDFGASKKVSETVLAKTGTMIGSAIYAAPEQVYGHATFASDIFSLGVTCLHLLTGVAPSDLIDRTTAGQWCWRHFLGNGRTISQGLGIILDRMLEYSTHRRYSGADEVLSDLNRIDRYVVRSRRIAWAKKAKRTRVLTRVFGNVGTALAFAGAMIFVVWAVTNLFKVLSAFVWQFNGLLHFPATGLGLFFLFFGVLTFLFILSGIVFSLSAILRGENYIAPLFLSAGTIAMIGAGFFFYKYVFGSYVFGSGVLH
jgi:tRNA A-37 threonylcarbamoyl transferase component Bud32